MSHDYKILEALSNHYLFLSIKSPEQVNLNVNYLTGSLKHCYPIVTLNL